MEKFLGKIRGLIILISQGLKFGSPTWWQWNRYQKYLESNASASFTFVLINNYYMLVICFRCWRNDKIVVSIQVPSNLLIPGYEVIHFLVIKVYSYANETEILFINVIFINGFLTNNKLNCVKGEGKPFFGKPLFSYLPSRIG